ncbi:rRNA-processing protein las1 [Curvularia kusanoi]|uniref:rRNA-processing protein las1 n=1 Tax=Curvularia kusanoi TaxID=90978 RepID=A0A9P4T8P2_CURKU|nr:rRNA-processing protein las1 [Curvularia kusanoi]
MMELHSRFVVTPWRSRQELMQLRRDLYGLNDDNVDRRQGAVNKVLAWRARKESLPLLLESTVDVVDVMIQDEKGVLDHNAKRLLYATAISRFITGYLDTQIDLTRDRPSWFPPGKALQPPLSLLEVRHCIVHRQMPSLGELKRSAQTALTWLWEWYWAHLEAAFGLPSSTPSSSHPFNHDNDSSGVSDRLHSLLKTYLRDRKSEIKAKRRGDLCTAANNAVAAYKARFSPSPTTPPSAATQAALLGVLVQQSLILPADKKAGSSMSGAFLVWTPLLLAFAVESASFVAELLALVINEMNGEWRREEEREGLCEWAVHALSSREWQGARAGQERAMREKVLGECMTELGTWNMRLAEGIISGMEDGEAQLWRAILDAGRSEVETEVMVPDHTRAVQEEKDEDAKMRVEVEVAEPLPAEEDVQPVDNAELSDATDKIKGPHKVVGLWKPKPIGWLPEGWDEDA